MTNLRELYYCDICGNVVEVVHTGQTSLVCCGEPMERLVEKTADEGMEKHVPVKEAAKNGVRVKVGDVPHPMTEKHYIQFIEVMTADQVLRTELLPDQPPEAVFSVDPAEVTGVRIYCNIHGAWKAE